MWTIRRTAFLLIALAVFTLMTVLTVQAMRSRQVTWPAIELAPIATGFSSPVHITNAGDGTGRLFVVEQAGQIEILGGGTFLDITGRVRDAGNEEGLLSVAFPPDYENSGVFYVYFTDDRAGNQGNNVLARFRVSEADPDSADPDSEQILITFEHPAHSNHNGGQLFFGPDNYLYIGTGDGGGGGDPDENAQDLGSLLGKILRIDVGAHTTVIATPGPFRIFLPFITSGNGSLYNIPADNPFVSDPQARDEIWASGLRNPWRFSFDRQTGDLWIGDVGQGSWEEIDYQPVTSPGGENYGWDCREGAHDYEFDSSCEGLVFVDPIFEYGQSGCQAVTGGYVYRGSAYPALEGIYFFADFCNGRIWGTQDDEMTWATQELITGSCNISSFGEDEAGELYITCRGGQIYQIVDAAP